MRIRALCLVLSAAVLMGKCLAAADEEGEEETGHSSRERTCPLSQLALSTTEVI